MATVVLQKGHCHRRRGATGTTGEQELASAVCDTAARLLQDAGHTPKVILADDSVPAGDVFVAVHADGSTSTSARGCSYGYRPNTGASAASRAFGEVWRAEHRRAGYPGTDRAANYTSALSGYYALRPAIAAGADRAIVVELGFLTNSEDRAWLRANPAACAAAIVNAVVRVHGGRLVGASAPAAPAAPAPSRPVTVPAPSAGGFLKVGDRGDRVRHVQMLLEGRGIAPGAHDGVFGPRTRDAVVAFQRREKLSVDGVVGRETWRRLRGPALLRQGSSGLTVRVLQERLTSKGVPTAADGEFGPATERSVRTFQERQGLARDGLVGDGTWTHLW